MDMLKCLLLAVLGWFSLTILVHAQDQLGFISIDCGSSTPYTDPQTGINYFSDTSYITTGESKTVSSEYDTDSLDRHLFTLRHFPEGVKNCYTLQPALGKQNRYLIRARFLHGNYDGQGGTLPRFDLYLGVNLWDSVSFNSTASIVTKEIMHTPPGDDIHVCLVNKGTGTPFISSLELRSMENDTYESPYPTLALFARWDVGSMSDKRFRYKDDTHDRFWNPKSLGQTQVLATNLTIDEKGSNDFHPPSIVMATAASPIDPTGDLDFSWNPDDPLTLHYVYLHYTELQLLAPNQTREFNIYANGKLFYGPVAPKYLSTGTIYSKTPLRGETIPFTLHRTERSTLPPILSAIEIYIVKDSSQRETNTQDGDGIMDIKSTYGVKKIWQGDPCAPQGYSWDGVSCSYNGSESPSITALNLSSSGLSGEIASSISKLTSLQSLDLSNNSLTGEVPDSLSQLPLTVLNLKGNKLTGSIPSKLIEKSDKGLLSLSVDPELCASVSCHEEKNNFVIPTVASVSVLVGLSAALAIAWCIKRKRKQSIVTLGKVDTDSIHHSRGSLESEQRQFTYGEVLTITNNLERVLGVGGFGKVFHGCLPDGTQVAVKMLSYEKSTQGYPQLRAEVNILKRVHHRNLTAFIGYCNEGTNMGLIYEYMANGNLETHLSEKNTQVLSWADRVQIAMDSAQGLEYLHNGCKPPIVHRDVKSTNILLNERFHAKLADFGLSRIFPTEGGTRTHVSTIVAGTPGYLDPEYYVSNRLNEKSDVYSFGVVLMEIIASRPVIIRTHENNVHISQWLHSMVQNGDISAIVDPRLRGNFDTNSAWKAVEIAMFCVSTASTERPAMNQVVTGLKECLDAEMARMKYNSKTDQSKDSVELIPRTLDTTLSPVAR